MLGRVFLDFVYDSSYLGTKKVHGYLISFEPQMVRSSFKDHLGKLKSIIIGLVIRKLHVGKFLTTFIVFW